MELQINLTMDGTIKYPLHKHKNYEVLFYKWGTGKLRTPEKDYDFSPGSIIIVPPGIMHGSASESGFMNISVCGEFKQMLHFESPVVLCDNAAGEGRQLAELIYSNRFGNAGYLSELCGAYVCFLMQNLKPRDCMSTEIGKIVGEITDRFYDSDIDLSALLNKSGYAEDYIRSHFKRITGKTPGEFLTGIRIKHACFLIEIYGNTLSLSQIAESCGYTDYVYFSKKFKAVTGVSPQKYKSNS